jgi:hypothetical protein
MTSLISKHLSDDHGSVSLDWVAPTVLFTRIEGSLSAELGGAFARTLQAQFQSVPMLHYFGDASRLDQYDLLARSAFMRVVLADRRRIQSFSFLTWAEGLSSVAQKFADLIGPTALVLTDRLEFEQRLLRYAPGARVVLDASAQLRRLPLRVQR